MYSIRKVLLIITVVVVATANLGTGFASAATANSSALPKTMWSMPAGKPKVVILTMHGGSWFQNEGFYQGTFELSQMFSKKSGAAAMNVEYSSGTGSLPDVIEAYDQAKQRYPNLPICAYGWSAGGNLALLLANHRKLACVVAEAAPTDLYTGSQGVKDAATFFFNSNWKPWSPVYTTKKLRQPTLLVSATNDPTVLHSQAIEFKKRFTKTKLITLRPGQAHFIHSDVNAKQFAAARNYEVRFVSAIGDQYAARRK